jgi:DNA replication licensing factor MCM7
MQARGSRFVRFQEIRVQEPMEQVPIGHIPRCINIRLQGDLTHRCSPGDIVTVAGVLLTTTTISETYVEALSIVHTNKSYAAINVDRQTAALVEASRGHDIYSRVANSIAPEIFGMEDVKKALLL